MNLFILFWSIVMELTGPLSFYSRMLKILRDFSLEGGFTFIEFLVCIIAVFEEFCKGSVRAFDFLYWSSIC